MLHDEPGRKDQGAYEDAKEGWLGRACLKRSLALGTVGRS